MPQLLTAGMPSSAGVAALESFPAAVTLGLPIQRSSDRVERRAAVLSADDPARYRYVLIRVWDGRLPVLVWVMLNPSTADGLVDDATIGRCRTYAVDWGYGGIVVVNLYALRSTKPTGLWAPGVEPIGEHNAELLAAYTSAEVTGGGPVACAWGANGWRNGRGAAVARELQAAGVQLSRLVVTVTGQPGHPGRLERDQRLVPLNVAAIQVDRRANRRAG